MPSFSRPLILTYLMITASVTAFIGASNDKSKKNDLTIGSRAWGDALLQQVQVQKPSSLLRVVTEERTLSGDGLSKITQITLTDQSLEGQGAKVSLLNGGPDHTYATLRFKSRRNHEINFLVEVYGMKTIKSNPLTG